MRRYIVHLSRHQIPSTALSKYKYNQSKLNSFTHLCERVARAWINQSNEILVDIPHDGITEKEDRLPSKNMDHVGPFEEVSHGD